MYEITASTAFSSTQVAGANEMGLAAITKTAPHYAIVPRIRDCQLGNEMPETLPSKVTSIATHTIIIMINGKMVKFVRG